MTTATITAATEKINEMKQQINVIIDQFEEFQNSSLRERVNLIKDKLSKEEFIRPYLRNNPLSDSEVEDILSLYSFYYDVRLSYSKLICIKQIAHSMSKNLEDDALRRNLGWFCHHIGNGISSLIMDIDMLFIEIKGPVLYPDNFMNILTTLIWIDKRLDDKRDWSSHPDVLNGEVPQEVWRSHERTVAFYRAFFS